MPQYTLRYFPVKALGEGIRLLLTYGNEGFENQIISMDEWPSIKPTTPYGVLPLLEMDGKTYHQSIAVCRYLGRRYGLAGDNELEALEIDQIVDTIIDLRAKLRFVGRADDVEAKEQAYQALSKTDIPFYLDKLEKIAAANNGHLAVGKLTWADLFFAGAYDYFKMITRVNLDEKAPNLKKVTDNVLSIPSIKAYYETAPKMEY